MAEPTQTIEGWYAFHDFRRIDWAKWKAADKTVRQQAIQEMLDLTQAWRRDDAERKGGFGVYAMAGHKADLMFVHFRPSLADLNECKTRLQKTHLADFMDTPYSYVSIIELSSYLSRPDVAPESDPKLRPRLYPTLASMMEHICFYPMNKRRDGNDNWYMLSMKERTELMTSHGMIGRSYAGNVTQIITGSTGFDDWEWGVTLYADDPLQFKKLVYEMRFDEVSARYAEFGPFYVGRAASDEDLTTLLQI